MFLSFSCGVCNDVSDSPLQQTSEQHSNGKLKGKNLIRSLLACVVRGRGRRGKREEIRERGTLFPFALFPPPLSSLSLFWCLPCVQEADKISRFHVVNLKPQLNLIMIKVVINSCAVGTMKLS